MTDRPFARARGLVVLAADPAARTRAEEVAHALAANLTYLHRRPATARRVGAAPPLGAPGDTFDVVAADEPDGSDLPVLLVASVDPARAAAALLAAGRVVLGVVATAPGAGGATPVLGVFPPVPGAGPADPLWRGRAADHLGTRVDLWPVLQVAAPR